MKTTLNHESTESILARLHAANAQFLPYYPGECGALGEPEAQTMTGLTIEELRAASFVRILQNRQK